MNFKEIRILAISLYKQGKSEEEIKKICKVPIDKETIANWMQEDEEKQKVKTMSKLTKRMKNIKKIEITEENREDIIEQLKDISFKILEIEPANEIAMNELVRCYSMQKQFEIGRVYGEKILNNNPNNIFTLYNMTRLEMVAGKIEKAKEYNDRLLKVDSENEQGNIQRKIIQEKILREKQKEELALERERKKQKELEIEETIRELNLQEEMQERERRQEEERRKQEFEKMISQNQKVVKPKTIEEEQAEFAKEQMKEEKYTLENQKKYMDTLQKMFYDGKINKRNIERIKEELYRYPDKIESAIFLSEVYYFITERLERGLEELNHFIDNAYTLSIRDYKILNTKVEEFRDKIDSRDSLKQKQMDTEKRQKELKAEQREYSRQIIKMIDNGELKKEDIPEIISRLEKYPDRSKAVFLIMKLHEGYGDREEALLFLAKYSKITNLSNEEKDSIIKMTKIISSDKKRNMVSERQKRVRARIKNKNKKDKYTVKVDRETIRQMIIEGNTIEEIYRKLSEEGKNVSLKAISKIKSHLIEKEPKLQSKYEEELNLAKIFFEEGNYTIEQVYQLFGYNIGKNKLLKIKEQLRVQKDDSKKTVEEK